MRSLSLALLIQTAMTFTALADPAETTDAVNLRAGPGTNYPVLSTLPERAQVDLTECDAEGAWCAIKAGDKTGFVSGKYLNISDESRPKWPQSFTTPNGAEITLFQPQVSDWKNYTDLSALVAAEYLATKDAKPAYGVIGLSAKTTADPDNDEVVLSDLKTTQLDFSTLDVADGLGSGLLRFCPPGAHAAALSLVAPSSA